MRKFADLIKDYTSINVNLIMEIGANYGQDAEGLKYYFKLNPVQIYVIEAHPEIYNELKKTYPNFSSFNVAAFNKSSEIVFNAVNLNGEKMLLESKKQQHVRTW